MVRLTETGYTQGLANWSPSGELVVYVVGAVGDAGRFDLYIMNRDGSGSRDVTPGYFPPGFLCREAVFAGSEDSLYFVGEWWAADS